jgi:hypothetical protein
LVELRDAPSRVVGGDQACSSWSRSIACLHKEVGLACGSKETGGVYRSRRPQESPFYKLVERFFPQF